MKDEKAKIAKSFFREYAGAIIGGLIAIILALTGLYKLIVTIILIVIGVFVGNYVQRNKDDVKEKLKTFIDKL